MKFTYQHTIYSCFIGYIVQAVVNNFVPLLFLTFHRSYDIPLSQITLLITINFCVQLLVDLLSVSFVDKIQYRTSMIIAHFTAAAGLILLAFLPELLPSPFPGLMIAVMIYAIGGGLLEVLVSPIVEACPTDNKETAMSMLHSFYCWGQVGVVLLSTLFFHFVGIGHWKILAILWAVIPLANIFLCANVPMASLIKEGEKGLSLAELLAQKGFWLFMLMMLCAGASEMAVSQWASTLAENALHVSKTLGDLMGPMTFAILMGSARAFYGKKGDSIHLDTFMLLSSILCTASYLTIALIPCAATGLIGCALTGLSIGIFWPGTFSKGSAAIPKGGASMFALFALAGDLGCSVGPGIAGMAASIFGDNLRIGILCACIFPLLMLTAILTDMKRSK